MITVYTPNFERVGTITDNESSVISNSFYSKGDFEIYIDKNKKYTEHLVEGNIVQFGNSKTDAGIITHRSLSRDDLGKTDNRLFIKGFTLEQLIYNRVIVPPIGRNYMSFEGNQEYIMKQFVYHNLVNAEDKNRNIPLILSKDKGLGKSDRWRGRYENLGEFLHKIGNYSNLGWEVSLDVKNKCFIFDVKKGVNRQNNNKIRPPIIFEVSFGNIFSREFIEDSTNSKNVLYGGGSGANENKIFQKVGDFKGLHRIEGYQEFTGVDSPIDLRKELENAAKELQPTKTFNVEVAPDKPFTFGKDYFLGDYVTVLDKELGVKLNTQITRVTKYDQGLSGIDITFGKDVLSFSSSTSSGSTGLIDIPSTSDIPEPTPGKPGKDGKDGKDGISLEYNWDNTKLGIKKENESSYSYVDLKGDKGDKGRDGVDGRHGLDGKDGKDGIGLDYSWIGTRLGIKKENESSYSYVDLKGDKGEKGDKGDPGSDANVTKTNIESALGFIPANKTDIPTLISHLKNDENFITSKDIKNINGLEVVDKGGYSFDNLKDTGVYRAWNSNTSPSSDNKDHIIIVFKYGSRVVQIAYTMEGGSDYRDIEYIRSFDGNWSEWYSTRKELDEKANKTDIPEKKVFLDDNVTESNSPSSFSNGVTISNNGASRFPTIGEWGMAITFKPTGARATQLYITKDGELWGRRAAGSSSWAKWNNSSGLIQDEYNNDEYKLIAKNGRFFLRKV